MSNGWQEIYSKGGDVGEVSAAFELGDKSSESGSHLLIASICNDHCSEPQ